MFVVPIPERSPHQEDHRLITNGAVREFLPRANTRLSTLLDLARQDARIEIYGALFGLRDAGFLSLFEFLGKRAHLVLANNAMKSEYLDADTKLRTGLRKSGAKLDDRMGVPGLLAHHSFLVFSRNSQAFRVWTRSSDWRSAGLPMQTDDGISIHSTALARHYLEAWNRL